MKTILYIVLVLMLCTSSLSAESDKYVTLEDFVSGYNEVMVTLEVEDYSGVDGSVALEHFTRTQTPDGLDSIEFTFAGDENATFTLVLYAGTNTIAYSKVNLKWLGPVEPPLSELVCVYAVIYGMGVVDDLFDCGTIMQQMGLYGGKLDPYAANNGQEIEIDKYLVGYQPDPSAGTVTYYVAY